MSTTRGRIRASCATWSPDELARPRGGERHPRADWSGVGYRRTARGCSDGAVSEDVTQAETTATFCATLVDEWIRAGVTDAVIAPGSRSTPMALALTARSEIDVHVHHDERAAAFTALGLGLATGRPAVVLTTSGTAAVELHPAVVEAHQAGVPLLAVTADRPPELHHVGAPQTVDQNRLYGEATRWFVEPGPPVAEASHTWRSLGSRAYAEATTGTSGPGPVHLNLGFREPLVGSPGELPTGRARGSDAGLPWHQTPTGIPELDGETNSVLARLLGGDRGLILAGAGGGDPQEILALAEAAGWPVLADPRSGCRTDHPAVVTHADAIVRHRATAEALRPDVVLRLGALPASKEVGLWLAKSGATQVVVDRWGRWHDPDRITGHVVNADPTSVVRSLLNGRAGTGSSRWLDRWRATEATAATTIAKVLGTHEEITEPEVARALCRVAGDGDSVVVSSSMPIRDVEWFGGRSRARILSNRGANGIDGVVSTAIGVALAGRGSGSATFALVGDVAFLHDSSALAALGRRGIDLTIVVVDNDGGGIFSFLPQARELETSRFEQLFGTPHGTDLAALAAAHGLVTITPSGASDLDAAFRAARAGGVQLVRVRTGRASNVEVHREIHASVAEALSDLFDL